MHEQHEPGSTSRGRRMANPRLLIAVLSGLTLVGEFALAVGLLQFRHGYLLRRAQHR